MNPSLLEFLQALKDAGFTETALNIGLSSLTVSEIVAPEIRGRDILG
jgi:hypothetical protein